MARSRSRSKRGRPRSKKSSGGAAISDEVKQSIFAVLLLAFGVVLFLGLFDAAGQVGMVLDTALASLFGWMRWLFALFVLVVGWNVLFPSRSMFGGLGYLGAGLFFLGFNGIINLFMVPLDEVSVEALQKAGGYIGLFYSSLLLQPLGFGGSLVLALATVVLALVLVFELSFDSLMAAKDRVKEGAEGLVDGMGPLLSKVQRDDDLEDLVDDDDTVLIEEEDEEEFEDDLEEEDDEAEEEMEDEGDHADEKVMTSKRRRRVQVPSDLLDDQSSDAVGADIDEGMDKIQRTFQNFNIEVEMESAKVGPTVTQYSLKPPKGVKLSKLVSLQNDLALALAAHPIRIEAPIPGKSLVGIEVPNLQIGSVGLRELIESKEFRQRKTPMLAPLGKDVGGSVVSLVVDKAPHMLVAGATGSGKSVSLNVIIVSLLYQNGPDDLKLIMVDPKRVELGRYAGIPHLLTPPIVKPDEAINALKWAVREMERRLDHLAKFGVRDIDSYNAKSKERMPKIVIVIDELADLMSQSNKRDVEAVIVRIAQMARAAGIHLILATQRPSVDVITGVIKANIPTRLAFAVASQVDSKTILDVSGAEKLLGRGDMLIQTPQLSKPKRLQGAYVSDDEIERIVNFLKKEGEPDYNHQITEHEKSGGTVFEEQAEEEPLMDDAIQLVLKTRKASTSYLQRRMRIGYSRAARIIDIMYEMGIIGEQNGSKPREVLITSWPPEEPKADEPEEVEEEYEEEVDDYDEEDDFDAEIEASRDDEEEEGEDW